LAQPKISINMKQILVTIMMFLIVGAGSAFAQDKKKAEAKQPVKTEAVKTLDAKDVKVAAEAKACAPGCEKACCSKSAAHGGKDADAKACKPGCAAQCCASKSAAHGGKDGAVKQCNHGDKGAKACAPGCEKSCCAKKVEEKRSDKDL
jgi:hypothetical protein